MAGQFCEITEFLILPFDAVAFITYSSMTTHTALQFFTCQTKKFTRTDLQRDISRIISSIFATSIQTDHSFNQLLPTYHLKMPDSREPDWAAASAEITVEVREFDPEHLPSVPVDLGDPSDYVLPSTSSLEQLVCGFDEHEDESAVKRCEVLIENINTIGGTDIAVDFDHPSYVDPDIRHCAPTGPYRARHNRSRTFQVDSLRQ